jgi:transcriptional regulator with XRE-family HTH domain
MDNIKIGQNIAVLRKERGYTQETLAEALSVSPQAVSKWENGRSLPETALLPGLAKLLDCSIESLLLSGRLRVLEARYGDGIENENVTKRLDRMVDEKGLSIIVNPISMASKAAAGRKRYLLLKYQNEAGTYYCAADEKEELTLTNETKSKSLPETDHEILAASYGNETAENDAAARIRHLRTFNMRSFKVDHANFPSVPMIDGPEYLTVVYTNRTGIHMVTCAEGEKLVLNEDMTGYTREVNDTGDSHIISGVDILPGFSKGMDCTWAGSLTVSLKAMGEDASYEKVMGVSGACWRIAFLGPEWDYSSVDGLVVYDYAEPGYHAFGYNPVFADRVEKEDRAAERRNIIESIRNNRPVLGINLRVAHEWGVICGYLNSGTEMLCRSYFDSEVISRPDFDNKGGTKEKYLPVDNWPFIIIRFSEKGRVPTEKENLVNSLRVRNESMNLTAIRNYAVGYNAYRAWQKDLRDDTWYAKADKTRFGRRLDVNYFCYLALCDARRCAAGYLESSAGLIAGSLLGELAEIYRKISEKVSGLLPELPVLEQGFVKPPVDTTKMRKVWTDELRHRQADLFDEVIELEKRGEEIARVIVG